MVDKRPKTSKFYRPSSYFVHKFCPKRFPSNSTYFIVKLLTFGNFLTPKKQENSSSFKRFVGTLKTPRQNSRLVACIYLTQRPPYIFRVHGPGARVLINRALSKRIFPFMRLNTSTFEFFHAILIDVVDNTLKL